MVCRHHQAMRALRSAIAEDWSLGDSLAAAQDCTISKLHRLRTYQSDCYVKDSRHGPAVVPSHSPLYSPDRGCPEPRFHMLSPPGPHF
eukprot:3291922-Rhodomonas_salina.1